MIFTLKSSSKDIPIIEYFANENFLYRKINFNFREENQEIWYDQVIIPPDKFNYNGLTNILISEKYPNDKMQSIINNYLLDTSNNVEFNEMQNWRKMSKQIAKDCLQFEEKQI